MPLPIRLKGNEQIHLILWEDVAEWDDGNPSAEGPYDNLKAEGTFPSMDEAAVWLQTFGLNRAEFTAEISGDTVAITAKPRHQAESGRDYKSTYYLKWQII